MSTLTVETARVFKPLLGPHRDKAAHGGRGSGKSHFFATQAALTAYAKPGTRIVCVREIQKSLKESAKRLIEDKIESLGLTGFRLLNDEIVTPGRGVIIFQGMQDHSAESIKSLEAFDVSWVEEAQTLSERSLGMLRPTIRKPESERWWSWNRRRKTDPVDALFSGEHKPPNSVVVQANWRDNPWFPRDLDADRLYDEVNSPDTYQHVWEGDYVGVQKGAYYASQLAQAKREGRICFVPRDPLMTIRAVFDIGGTGAKADAVAIWVCQFIGKSINVLDYYEVVGQPLAAHVAWLRANGYDHCLCILPHDGANHGYVYDVTYESALKDAGFDVIVVPNQGTGAALQRVETARRRFGAVWFNKATTQPGRDALGWYHERKDEARGIGLGPEHDWSSNGADSFGLMCVAYEAPKIKREEAVGVETISPEDVNTAWLGN